MLTVACRGRCDRGVEVVDGRIVTAQAVSEPSNAIQAESCPALAVSVLTLQSPYRDRASCKNLRVTELEKQISVRSLGRCWVALRNFLRRAERGNVSSDVGGFYPTYRHVRHLRMRIEQEECQLR